MRTDLVNDLVQRPELCREQPCERIAIFAVLRPSVSIVLLVFGSFEPQEIKELGLSFGCFCFLDWVFEKVFLLKCFMMSFFRGSGLQRCHFVIFCDHIINGFGSVFS